MKRNFGFINEKLDMKILILFVLRRVPKAVSFEEMAELFMDNDGISYFDCADCASDLVKTGHLQVKSGKYFITEKGSRNSEITENSLPFSVRQEAEKRALKMRGQQIRNEMIKTTHITNPDGSYKVALSLSDDFGEIISMELLSINETQAADMEKNFREKAEIIYSGLIEKILRGS
jgi:hypothetical protein